MRPLRSTLCVMPWAVLVSACSSPTHDADTFETRQTCVEVNGERICSPLHFVAQRSTALILEGSASLSAWDDRLASLDLQPVSVDGAAYMYLVMLDYHESDIGSYREFLVQVLVEELQPERTFTTRWQLLDDFSSHGGLDPELGFYLDHLTLDSDDRSVVDTAVLGGRAAGNFPKSYGHQMELSRDDGWFSDGWRATVGERDTDQTELDRAPFEDLGSWTIEMDMRAYLPAAISTTQYRIVTGLNGTACWQDAWSTSRASIHIFGGGDSFWATGGADDLINEQLGFTPQFWVVQRDLQTELISERLCGPGIE